MTCLLRLLLALTVSQFSSDQSLSCVRLFATPWTAALQASLSITNSQSSLKLMSIESVMPLNHLISVVAFSSCLHSFLASWYFQMSQFFASGDQSIGVSVQHHSFQWIFRTGYLKDWLVWSPCSPRDSQESSPTPQFKSRNQSDKRSEMSQT